MLVIYIVLFLLLLLYFNRTLENFFPLYTYLLGASERLYTLLSSVKTIFERNGIPYAITSNLLEDAIYKKKLRNGQQIGTILVPEHFIRNVIELTKDFVDLGFGFNDLPDGTLRLSGSISLPVIPDVVLHIVPIQFTGRRWISQSKINLGVEIYNHTDLFPLKL